MADIPVVDSHIHLYPEKEIPTLAWAKLDHPLAQQRSVEDYKEAAGDQSSLKGFIFIETDRKNDLEAGAADGSGWKYPLMEISWLKRIALGEPKDGEGHTKEDAHLCLAIIPWAPIPSGVEAMERYLELAEKAAGASWDKVKGFRYLVQDKPYGTMLEDDFIASLKLLGRKGFIFDVGVDQHRRGKKQLDELLEMIGRAHDGVPDGEKVTFIINHMCKPDLDIYNQTDPGFVSWRTTIYALSKCDHTYMKISGGFSEMSNSLKQRPADEIFMAIHPWLLVLLATFGASRMMFGSDWPVCTVGLDDAWKKWHAVVERMCFMGSLGEEDKKMLFAGTAEKAYRI